MPEKNGQPIDSSGYAIERRRPGRRDVSPALIPLLRRPAGDGVIRENAYLDNETALLAWQDPIGPARGIAMSILLSLPVWGLISVLDLALRR